MNIENRILSELEAGPMRITELFDRTPFHTTMVWRQVDSLTAQGKVTQTPIKMNDQESTMLELAHV